MRGKVFLAGSGCIFWRITPAYAGKSDSTFPFKMIQQGSPPPMRGKATTLVVDKSSHGITPAYAGKRLKRS